MCKITFYIYLPSSQNTIGCLDESHNACQNVLVIFPIYNYIGHFLGQIIIIFLNHILV